MHKHSRTVEAAPAQAPPPASSPSPSSPNPTTTSTAAAAMDIDTPPALSPLTVLSRLDLDGTRPVTDPKHYRLITLSNGLEALLVHDPRITQVSAEAAAAAAAAAAAGGKRGRKRREKEEEEGGSDEDDDESGSSGSSGSEGEEDSEGDDDDEDDDEASASSCELDASAASTTINGNGKGKAPALDALDTSLSLSTSSNFPSDSHEIESPRRKKRHPHHLYAPPHVGGHGEEEICLGGPEHDHPPHLAPTTDGDESGAAGAAAGAAAGSATGGGGGEDGGGVRLSAAAMAVGVGSFNDPEGVQGLAHYLEHMLFMGSEKYPDENNYDSFISSRGGYSNAMTECEYTVYHFEVPPASFSEILDIFAQFFISPLMRAEASARELEAIESEFNLSRGSDNTRCTQLICHTSHPSHPYSRFSWGNLSSLRDAPLAAGLDITEELRRFHQQHYTALKMKLVLLGMEDLDTLEQTVCQTFAGVRAPPSLPLSLSPSVLEGLPPPMDETNALGWLFRVVPVRDLHQLHVTWQLPSLLQQYRAKPWEYLG